MKLKINFLSIFLILFFISCSTHNDVNSIEMDLENKLPDGCLYFNSFETSADLADFGGIYYLEEDIPMEGGDSSLYISGGCIWPHLHLTLGPFDEEKILSFTIWGKSDIMAGGVSMKIKDDTNAKSIFAEENKWNFYESEKLIVPQGKQIQIGMGSGGIASGGAFFDLLKIIEHH